MSALKDLEDYVDQTVSTFLEKMKENEGQNIDMGRWVQLFAFGTYALLATYSTLRIKAVRKVSC
jgi:hypothetical protein